MYYDENLDKLKKLNIILNTTLMVQVVLLGLHSLALHRCWNMPNKTDQKYISYIINSLPTFSMGPGVFLNLFLIYALKYTTWIEQKVKICL